MAKELEKNYNPAEIEPRLYEKWVANKYFHAEVRPEQKTVHHRDAATKHYRTVAYGTCTR